MLAIRPPGAADGCVEVEDGEATVQGVLDILPPGDAAGSMAMQDGDASRPAMLAIRPPGVARAEPFVMPEGNAGQDVPRASRHRRSLRTRYNA